MTSVPCIEDPDVPGRRRHAWDRRGLDVRDDRLVSVRRCVWCHTEQVTAYKVQLTSRAR